MSRLHCMAVLFAICGILHEVTVQRQNPPTSSLSRWWREFSTSHPKYKETTTILRKMAQQFPSLVQLYSIGRSVNGLEMWVVHVAENVNMGRPLMRPMVKIVSNMHGDEVLGRSLSLMLAVYLVYGYENRNPRIIKLLRTTDIHLLFSVNPDGYEAAVEGVCSPNSRVLGRRNKNRVDLNRNFPDQFSSNIPEPEVETINVMKWIQRNPFVLSANMHGGALVASYPFDSLSINAIKNVPGYDYFNRNVPSLSPDNAVFVYLSKLYSNAHPEMHLGNLGEGGACETNDFPGGITNGAEWYNVQGGMQDFNYVHSNCFEVTFELSCCKFPAGKTLLKEWNNNKEALLQYLEAAQMGIKGYIKGARAGTKILVDGIDHAITVTNRGEYWRLLVPGVYRVIITAPGFRSHVFKNVYVARSNTPTILNHTFSTY